MRLLFLLCLTLCLNAPALAAESTPFRPVYLAAYQGTYRFPDGSCVTGGRMDENGIRLLYMDVWQNRTAMLFADRDGRLESLIPPGLTLHMRDGGKAMEVVREDGSTRTATRIHKPASRAVQFSSDGLTLAGTLYLPAADDRKLPAVVLAHGSGPVDRFGGTWITYFTNLGFAVLAYDKRGVGQSGGDWHTATYRELAGDLDAAVDWLARQPEVDPGRLGVHSSSQSGWYAPLAAHQDARIRFLIQRAGPGLWVGPVTTHEQESDWRAAGVAEADIRPAAELWTRLNDLARRGGSRKQAQRLLAEAQNKAWFKATYGDWGTVDPGWWRRLVSNAGLNPAETAGKLRIPVLWFLADQDQNVPYAKSRAAVAAAAEQPGTDITLVTIHNAPHSFVVTESDGSRHYTNRYWPAMADWLKARKMTAADFTNCGLEPSH